MKSLSCLLAPPARLAPLLLLAYAAACDSDPGGPDPEPEPCMGPTDAGICFEVRATGLEYPLQLEQPPGEDRLFVAEQVGRIRVLEDGVLLSEPVLDLTGEVQFAAERGLIGMAFHPGYASNGYVYVMFTDAQGSNRIQRFTATPGGDALDPGSRTEILVIDRPPARHNGGLLRFGPDGMLWVALGDATQPWEAQDSTSLHGSLLRLDVDGGAPYAIPADNPFVGAPGARPEIWATGLRNPWRFSFEAGGRLFIADVGESSWEELNVVAADAPGHDFGWPAMEGDHCYLVVDCDPGHYTRPAFEYGRDTGCSIIGGGFYNRDDLPGLAGRYVLGDFCGWVGSVAVDGTEASDLQTLDFGDFGRVTSLGFDADGRVYVLTYSEVALLRPDPDAE